MPRQATMIYDQSSRINQFTNDTEDTLLVGSIIPLAAGRIGIIQQTVLPGESGVLLCHGQWAIQLKTGDTPSVGSVLYYDAAAAELTTTATDNTRAGVMVSGHNMPAGTVCCDIGM